MTTSPAKNPSRHSQETRPTLTSPNRRALMQGAAAALTILISGERAQADQAPLTSTLNSMSALTGSPIENRWLEPTAALVNLIMEDSKPLRALQLSSIEPATHFTTGT